MSATNSKKKSAKKAPKPWYLVTNHLNLLYMLAAGLVMEPSGFGRKYYVDPLEAIPGLIPLFRNAIPLKALEQAVSERGHLRPCVVLLDLSGVSGDVHVFSREGKIRAAKLPNIRLGKNGVGILVRAPLPLTMFSGIYFQSEEDRQTFETAANDVSNVDLLPYRIDVDESLFSGETTTEWPPVEQELRTKDFKDLKGMSLDRASENNISAQDLGGLITMLYHCANRSDLGLKVFKRIIGCARNANTDPVQNPFLAELPNWLGEVGVSECSNSRVRLYWGAMDALVAAQQGNDLLQPVDVVLEYFDAQLKQLTGEGDRLNLEKLTADMRSIHGLSSGTISELFQSYKGNFSRSFLLFCLLKDCKDLLEFSHPSLEDGEYLLAAMLFGVRDGWLRQPFEMRNQSLSAYVSYRMASVAHEKQKSALCLPTTPSPEPLRQFFAVGPNAWSKSQKNAAIEISKASKWLDCIETHIAAAGDTPLVSPKQESGKFIFPGEVTLTIEVRREAFLKRLGAWPPIDGKLESKIKNDLNAARKEEVSRG